MPTKNRVILAAAFLFITLLIAAAPEPARKEITIDNMTFSPDHIDINVNDTLVWTNNDDRDHTVVAADSSFTSGNLTHGETFEHKFTAPGKFSYGCKLHPRMKATITVTAAK